MQPLQAPYSSTGGGRLSKSIAAVNKADNAVMVAHGRRLLVDAIVVDFRIVVCKLSDSSVVAVDGETLFCALGLLRHLLQSEADSNAGPSMGSSFILALSANSQQFSADRLSCLLGLFSQSSGKCSNPGEGEKAAGQLGKWPLLG
jgi:hypothetical protein